MFFFVIAGTTTLAAAEVLIVECDDSADVDFTDENIVALPTCLLQRALIETTGNIVLVTFADYVLGEQDPLPGTV
ncbi:hypothetical protein BpHYR1_025407 [Brachionus plicatilis]|uniref:Secreted protein n=1 Tax=Brachionus plicatilis TaxID=10195 RepID=A0A3M7Q8T5_BRAPC|nr:hypothetical protein BpHYR1_025407 [Brachionus plicatilis]